MLELQSVRMTLNKCIYVLCFIVIETKEGEERYVM